MTIRKKLTVLLLSLALIPLIGVGIFYQLSFQMTAEKVSDDIRRILDRNARSSMRRVLSDFDKILRIKTNLHESLIEIQKTEVEHILTMSFPPIPYDPNNNTIEVTPRS